MILLDAHVWLWWAHKSARLPDGHRQYLEEHLAGGPGISIVSCWEVAKLVSKNRIVLPLPLAEWMEQALNYPGVHLLDLSLAIVIESVSLPPSFHNDPADQMNVATARLYDIPLMTLDARILAYPHVNTAP